MTLTKDDLQAIGTLIEHRVRPIVKEEINVLRAEMHEAFSKQGESLTRAIADAVKLMAKDREDTKEEIEELRDEVQDLRTRLEKLESRQSTP